jgi:histidine ammonia-lyase
MIRLDGRTLALDDVAAVARRGEPVEIAASARSAMERSRTWVLAAARGDHVGPDGAPRRVYGINTGYGSLARVILPPGRGAELSANLIRSHAAGTGPPFDDEVVRAAMLLRANALAQGCSGVAVDVVDTLLAMLHAGVTPVVPSRGSCGSSGDLAPLAHIGLVLFDGAEHESGRARHAGIETSGARAMAAAGLARVPIGPKDALAMTNGAVVTTAMAALSTVDAAALIHAAEVATALSFEALRGVTVALDPRVHALRPHPGALQTASALRDLLAGSGLVDSGERVQDAYTLRCAPTVLGAVRDALRYAAGIVAVEVNSVTDNPVVLAEDDGALSAGLFHGEPVGFAADSLRAALTSLAAMSERRTHRLTTSALSGSLPAGLADGPGVGLLMTASTAAALVHDMRATAWPASADSIPTCEDQEDYVAMATTAARRTREAVATARRVVAIELLCAATAVALRAPLNPAPATRSAVDAVLHATAGAPSPGAAVEALADGLQAIVSATGVSLPDCLP